MDLMNRVFQECLDKFIIDDILVYSHTIEKHELHLKIVLEKELYVMFSKCKFLLRKVVFLGHVVSEKGISMNLSKVEAVSQWK